MQATQISEKLQVGFWRKVDKTAGCWNWTGYALKHGYGMKTIRGVGYLAHRLSYILEHGEIPYGKHVLHRCDNPSCVNPAHLFLGNPKINSDDCRAKGRMFVPTPPKGSASKIAKLTEARLANVNALHAAGFSFKYLGRLFGVSEGTLIAAYRRKTWKHVSLFRRLPSPNWVQFPYNPQMSTRAC
jgi:hypothetical protein